MRVISVYNYFRIVARGKAEVKSTGTEKKRERDRERGVVFGKLSVTEIYSKKLARVSRSVYLQKATNIVKAEIKGNPLA